jgi:hypothetical protein
MLAHSKRTTQENPHRKAKPMDFPASRTVGKVVLLSDHSACGTLLWHPKFILLTIQELFKNPDKATTRK